MEQNKNAEQQVIAYIQGQDMPPEELREYVEIYSKYERNRGNCVSFPRHEDSRMNRIFDHMISVVQYNRV